MKPLKITFHLENDVCLSGHNNPIDGIFAKLHIEKLKREGRFDGNYDVSLPFIKNTDGIYHTSVFFYDIKHLDNYFIKKAFDLGLYREYGDKPDLKSVENAGSGSFKSYVLNFEKKCVEEIKAFVCGDEEIICEYLSNVKYIGKKSSLGFGKVSKIEVEEIDTDLSITDGKQLNRPMPYGHSLIPEGIETVSYFGNVIFPYWKKGSETICARSKK